jgi:hypothetical protein
MARKTAATPTTEDAAAVVANIDATDAIDAVDAAAAADAAADAPAPAPKTRPVKRYTITKRVVIVYTYIVDAYTEAEALAIANDTGEVNADEVSNVSESWKVHRELNRIVGTDIVG